MCYFWLGDIYAHTGDLKRAELCYLKAYAHTNSATCLYQLAIAFKRAGLLQQAKLYATKAISAYEDTIGNKCP